MGRSWRGTMLLGVLIVVGGCGTPPGSATSRATAPATAVPSSGPTITATATPLPTPTGTAVAVEARGIPGLHQMGQAAWSYGDALSRELDRIDPGHAHQATCEPVPMLWMPGANTRCDVVTDAGAPARWTALTVEMPTPEGANVIEFSEGQRTGLPPFPPQ